MQVLTQLCVRAFVVALALMDESLPLPVQQALYELPDDLESNTNRLLEIMESHPLLDARFREVRVVEQLRSHQYHLLAQQQPQSIIPLPDESDWLPVALKVLKASDSVREVKSLLATKPLLADYMRSVKSQLV